MRVFLFIVMIFAATAVPAQAQSVYSGGQNQNTQLNQIREQQRQQEMRLQQQKLEEQRLAEEARRRQQNNAAADPDVDELDMYGEPAGTESSFVNPYSKKYKKEIPKDPEDLRPMGPLAEGAYSVYLVRLPGVDRDTATLRLSSNVALTGCARIKMPALEIRENGKLLSIKVIDGRVKLIPGVRYAHFQCDTRMQFVTADIPLSRSDIIAKGIERIALKSSSTAVDYFDIAVDESRIALIPKTTAAFKPMRVGGKTDPLSYWYYPPETVVLFVPSAPRDAKLDGEIRALAASRGLDEIETALAGFEPPSQNGRSYYFLDPKGVFAHAGGAAITPVGSVKLKGARTLGVFARPPGYYD